MSERTPAPGAVRVRPFVAEDRPEWLRMRTALWPDHTAADRDAWLARADTIVLVAEREPGRLVGFAELGLRSYADGCDSSPVPYLEGWWVDAEARRQGVGRALMAAGEAWARDHGHADLASDTPVENTVSQAAHTRLGFAEVERAVLYRKALRVDRGTSEPDAGHAVSRYFDTIARLIEYEAWCNLRALDAVERLSETEVRRDFGFGWRTPHATLFHIADVMRGWAGAVGPVIKKPTWSPYRETMTLGEIRSIIEEAGESLLRAARASDAAAVLDQDRRLHQVFHLVTHGTHHRGQLLSMLTLMGRPQPFEGGDFGGWSNT